MRISLYGYYSLWMVISISYLAAAYAIYEWSIILGNVRRRFFRGLSLLLVVHAVIGIAMTCFGIIRAANGFNDVFETLGWLGIIRLFQNLLFAVIFSFTLCWVVFRSRNLSADQRATLRAAAKAFERLDRVLHNTK